MTEDQAKTKWCPFVRTGAFTDRGPTMAIAVNRDPRDEVSSSCLCIASACMAWRWAREKETAAYLADVQRHMKDHNVDFAKATGAVWKEFAGTYTNIEGFCGLAGKPA